MTHNGGIHVDDALALLEQPIAESLMIPLDVIMLRVLSYSVAEMPLSQWNDLG